MDVVKNTGSINFGGLESGLDTDKVVTELVKVQKEPIRRIETREALLATHRALYDGVGKMLQELGTTLATMESAATFLMMQAHSTQASAVEATAGAGAQRGEYRIEVTCLAQPHKSISDAVQSANAPGLTGEGGLHFSVGDVPYFVPTNADTTLFTLADDINQKKAGITASIVFDGDGHRLKIFGNQSGHANKVVFQPGDLGPLALDAGRNQGQEAQDCDIILDDLVALKRPSNVINDAIGGVTLNVRQKNCVSEISVNVDIDKTLARLESFVASYNKIISETRDITSYDGAVARDKLVGDTTLQGLLRKMQSVATSTQIETDSGPVTLMRLGITTQKDGTLGLDMQKLTRAVAERPEDLAKLMGRDIKGGTRGIAPMMQDVIRHYASQAAGLLNVKTRGLDGQSRHNKERMASLNKNVEKYESTLRDKFNRLESQMSKIKQQSSFLNQTSQQSQKK